MPTQTLLFDFDGTLADTAPAIIATMNATFTQFGFQQKEEAQIRTLIGKPLEEMFQTLQPNCNKEILTAAYKNSYLEYAKECVFLFDGAADFLQKSKEKGVKMAIVSTKSETAIRTHLTDLGVIDLFDEILGRESVTKQKPDAEGILLAMKKLNATPLSTIMVGDTEDDLQAAKNAGIHCALVEWTNQNKNDLVQKFNFFLISSFTELNLEDMFRSEKIEHKIKSDLKII